MTLIRVPEELWMSANDRFHWTQRSTRTKALRGLGCLAARAAGLRDLGPTLVTAHIGYPRAGRADPANAYPTVKALIDGFVDAGVWSDDDHTHVIGPMFRRDKPSGAPGVHTIRFTFTAQEVPF